MLSRGPISSSMTSTLGRATTVAGEVGEASSMVVNFREAGRGPPVWQSEASGPRRCRWRSSLPLNGQGQELPAEPDYRAGAGFGRSLQLTPWSVRQYFCAAAFRLSVVTRRETAAQCRANNLEMDGFLPELFFRLGEGLVGAFGPEANSYDRCTHDQQARAKARPGERRKRKSFHV